MSLAKVEKLLRLALGSPNGNEASAAALAAVKLMATSKLVLSEKGQASAPFLETMTRLDAVRAASLEQTVALQDQSLTVLRRRVAELSSRPSWDLVQAFGFGGVIVGVALIALVLGASGALDERPMLARCAPDPEVAAQEGDSK